jgi:hypothetical protein
MYATVRRYEGVSDPGDAARRVNEGFVPFISEIPGFVAYYWVDAGDNVMVSTSVFEDETRRGGIEQKSCRLGPRESSVGAPEPTTNHSRFNRRTFGAIATNWYRQPQLKRKRAGDGSPLAIVEARGLSGLSGVIDNRLRSVTPTV